MAELGRGILDWNKEERQTGRFGSIHLELPDGSPVSLLQGEEGSHGRLVALVLLNHESWTHTPKELIDAGLRPKSKVIRVPRIGSKIILGEGTLFFEDGSVGLRPDDGRADDWLKYNALYRAHEQFVVLSFEETPRN